MSAPSIEGEVSQAARMSVGTPRHHMVIFATLFALLLVAPFILYPVFLMKVLCFALFSAALNLLLGFGGLLSFGHAAFFGSASYVSAHAAKVWGLTPELAILLGTGAAAVLGLGIGALAIRRQGIYFAMVTLAFAQMIFFFALQAPFTGGEDGIQAVPRGRLFGLIDTSNDLTLYFIVLAIVFGGILPIYRIVHSPFGQVLKAIRDNEPRSISIGYKVNRYKLAVFVMSATLAGLAWRHQGDRLPAGLAHRRLLDDVGRGGADDAHRRHGDDLWAAGRCRHHRHHAELLRKLRRLGDGPTGTIFVLSVMLFREGIVGVISRWIKKPL